MSEKRPLCRRSKLQNRNWAGDIRISEALLGEGKLQIQTTTTNVRVQKLCASLAWKSKGNV